MTLARQPAAVPADFLLHPAALAALAVLAVNDHLLKRAAPGMVSGKLSDVAGLVISPLVLVGLWEVGAACVRRRDGREERRTSVVLAVLGTAVAFMAVKTLQPVADLAAEWLAALQWPFHAAIAVAGGETPWSLAAGSLLADPTDLIALPVLLLPWWIVVDSARRDLQ